MSAGNKGTFGGVIGNTIATSKPWWPVPTRPPVGAPNILIVLFDDVGFSDFGCYGSPIKTPTIDRLAAEGLRYTSFHTTAMCSTTRAALLTGRNHHSVGVGCLANFDSGYPGYRGKIAREAGTLAEMLREQSYRNRSVRRLAAGAGLRSLLRLSRCGDRPIRAGTGVRQHAYRAAGDFRRRLSSDCRSGGSGDPLHWRSHRRSARPALADLARLRRLPCAASGAIAHHQRL